MQPVHRLVEVATQQMSENLIAKGSGVCDGVCISLQNDTQNCGACGNQCGFGLFCIAGQCTCQAGFSACPSPFGGGNVCINTTSDRRNCGGCGAVCPGGQLGACVAGACTCQPGYTACGTGTDACKNLAFDRANCGSCGNACSAVEVCNNGQCVSP